MSIGRRETARAFGQALRAARLAKGVSQEQLAEGAELHRTTPSLYERGLRTPTLTVLFDIGRALDIEPTQLVSATIDRLRRNSHE
jgi:transcriptional regulator with XRE-family HTH domain